MKTETQKIIVQEDGTVYQLKKPLYRQGLFYAFVAMTIIAIWGWWGAAAFLEENEALKQQSEKNRIASELVDNIATAKENGLSDVVVLGLVSKAMGDLGYSDEFSEESTSDVEESTSGSSFKIGESIAFNDNSKVTVTEVREAPEVEMYEVAEGHVKVIVNVVIENTGSTPLSFNAQRFALYDANSEMGDFNSSTYGNNVPNEIASGMKANFNIHFTAKAKGPFKVSYADVIWKE